jgi:hypothetical protein
MRCKNNNPLATSAKVLAGQALASTQAPLDKYLNGLRKEERNEPSDVLRPIFQLTSQGFRSSASLRRILIQQGLQEQL